MFVIYDYNPVFEDFEALDVFSTKEAAQDFLDRRPRNPANKLLPAIVEQGFKEFRDQAVKVALGELSHALTTLVRTFADSSADTMSVLQRAFDKFGVSEEPTTFDQRVAAERKQLGERLFKLRDFLGSKKFNELSDRERARLNRQVTLMSEYYEVLAERLDCAFQ